MQYFLFLLAWTFSNQEKNQAKFKRKKDLNHKILVKIIILKICHKIKQMRMNKLKKLNKRVLLSMRQKKYRDKLKFRYQKFHNQK